MKQEKESRSHLYKREMLRMLRETTLGKERGSWRNATGLTEQGELKRPKYKIMPVLTIEEFEGMRKTAKVILGDEVAAERAIENTVRLLSTRESKIGRQPDQEPHNEILSHNRSLLDSPRWARFALLLIPPKSREHLVGDLEEEYTTIVLPQYGRFWARLWYWEQTLFALGFTFGPC